MKIILSRKGFDSASGGFASPILPDGKIVSLPIPEKASGVKYSDLRLGNESTYYSLMSSLCGGKIKADKNLQPLSPDTSCHLDPDISQEIIARANRWRGAFGQIDQSATHLSNQGVQIGDLFLFFGWFRRTISNNNRILYDKMDKDGRHVLFGYMEVGEIIKTETTMLGYEWLGNHPHLHETRTNKATNTLYLASKQLSFSPQLSGCGTFQFSPELVLSQEGMTKSKWALPDFFKNVDISYHSKDSWKEGYFQSVGRGQEFVLDATDEIENWVHGIINRNIAEVQVANETEKIE